MVATIATVPTRNRNHGDRNVRRKTHWPRRKIDRYPSRSTVAQITPPKPRTIHPCVLEWFTWLSAYSCPAP